MTGPHVDVPDDGGGGGAAGHSNGVGTNVTPPSTPGVQQARAQGWPGRRTKHDPQCSPSSGLQIGPGAGPGSAGCAGAGGVAALRPVPTPATETRERDAPRLARPARTITA